MNPLMNALWEGTQRGTAHSRSDALIGRIRPQAGWGSQSKRDHRDDADPGNTRNKCEVREPSACATAVILRWGARPAPMPRTPLSG